jgi:2-oxo-4-hydroxy-4-carboxy-5-ureidoimidazoline decarboxylase
MNLEKINNSAREDAVTFFLKCCGSESWINKMLSSRPFNTREELLKKSAEIWYSLEPSDWKEAFEHHPKIGDLKSLKEKYSVTKSIAANEQSGIDNADESILRELSELNEEYEKKFGYIFIVCATGKSADEMLSVIKLRIRNSPETEIKTAMEEQNKITKIRLEKIL